MVQGEMERLLAPSLGYRMLPLSPRALGLGAALEHSFEPSAPHPGLLRSPPVSALSNGQISVSQVLEAPCKVSLLPQGPLHPWIPEGGGFLCLQRGFDSREEALGPLCWNQAAHHLLLRDAHQQPVGSQSTEHPGVLLVGQEHGHEIQDNPCSLQPYLSCSPLHSHMVLCPPLCPTFSPMVPF